MVKRCVLYEAITHVTEVRGLFFHVERPLWTEQDVCVCTLSVDGTKPKMEEMLASHSEPKWHQSDFISLAR